MMTMREISPSENISASSAGQTQTQTQTRTLDPKKSKAARRKRLEIQKLRATWGDAAAAAAHQNGVVKGQHHQSSSLSTVLSHGAVSVMGRRREMEDAVSAELGLLQIGDDVNNSNNKYDFFGVYDGHGGRHVAEACRDRMHKIVAEETGKDTWRKVDDGVGGVEWEKMMVRCFERMDREVGGGGGEDMEEMTVGSTAVMAVVGKDEIVVANCGDSRAVICRNGVAVPLSFDHKPDRPDELARIEAAGGRVINWNGFRVLGVLATSRSIGDHYLKPYVSCTPEVTISKRTDEDEFLILASDGLWDVISNEFACQIARRCLTGRIQRTPGITDGLSRSSRAEVAAALITELAIAKGSKDNISVVVVELRKFSRFIC